MNPKKYLVALLVLLVLGGFVLMARNQFFLPKASPTENLLGWKFSVDKFPVSGQVTESGAYSEIRKTEGTPRGLPVRLQIPSIGVDSTIEDAHITSDGRMDVPAGSVNVAWFAIGTVPGQKGSAVIGGHYGIDDGVPKVFYSLNKLKVGDKAYIVDDKNNTLAFVVRSIRLFDRNADSATVFYSNDGLAHLNIITCEGVWNKVNDSYPDRRVVFTDLVAGEGPVVVSKISPSISKIVPSLPQTDIVVNQNETGVTPSFFQKLITNILDRFNDIGR